LGDDEKDTDQFCHDPASFLFDDLHDDGYLAAAALPLIKHPLVQWWVQKKI